MSEHVTIQHPKSKATASVRKGAVAGWARAGWQPVQDGDATAVAAVEPSHYLVLAGSRTDALAWAKDHDVPQSAVTYASGVDAVSGVNTDGLQVVELDSFAGHRHEADIRAAVTAAFTPASQPAPVGTQDAAAAGSSTAPTQE